MDRITNYFDFESNVGKKVKIIGKLASEIWQHITKFIESHPYMYYFDLDDDHQILIYTKDKVNSDKKIIAIGELIRTESKQKNPRSKITEIYFEYQLIVESWRSLEDDR